MLEVQSTDSLCRTERTKTHKGAAHRNLYIRYLVKKKEDIQTDTLFLQFILVHLFFHAHFGFSRLSSSFHFDNRYAGIV